jgi:hypothetical protein
MPNIKALYLQTIRFFKFLLYVHSENQWPPGSNQFWPQGNNLNNLGRGSIQMCHAKYLTSSLCQFSVFTIYIKGKPLTPRAGLNLKLEAKFEQFGTEPIYQISKLCTFSKKVFKVFTICTYSENQWPPGWGQFWPQGYNLNNLGRGRPISTP